MPEVVLCNVVYHWSKLNIQWDCSFNNSRIVIKANTLVSATSIVEGGAMLC